MRLIEFHGWQKDYVSVTGNYAFIIYSNNDLSTFSFAPWEIYVLLEEEYENNS